MKNKIYLLCGIMLLTLLLPMISGEASVNGIDTFEFDIATGITPTSIKVEDSAGGSIYAVFYEGVQADGFVSTYEVLNDGSIVTPLIDTFEFDIATGITPSAIKYSDNIFLVIYQGLGGDGFAKSIYIFDNGTINGTIDTFEIDETDLRKPNLFWINQSNGRIGVTSTQFLTDAVLGVGYVEANGSIVREARNVFEVVSAIDVDSISVSDDIVLVSFHDIGVGGRLGTLLILENGTANIIDEQIFDVSQGTESYLAYMGDNIYSIVYKDTGVVGTLKTFEVLPNGTISTIIDTQIFETTGGSSAYLNPYSIKIDNDILAIVYRRGDNLGQLDLWEIDTNGNIVGQLFNFTYDATQTFNQELLHFKDDIYILSYEGDANDGFIKTINITNGCVENWVQYNSSCGYYNGTWDKLQITYSDSNDCGTFDNLPANNGTLEDCDYCSPIWTCCSYNESCGDLPTSPPIITCSNTSLSNNATCCDVTGLESDCNYTGDYSEFDKLCGNISVLLVLPSYPYVDLNTTFDMQLFLYQNDISTNSTDFKMEIREPDGNTSVFNWTWDETNQRYEKSLIFLEEGSYPFTISAYCPYDAIQNITGTLIVAEPYYITFKIWEQKDLDLDPYKNDFGFVLLEFKEDRHYDPILENFIYPFVFSRTETPVFHSSYIDGEATIKLWESGDDVEYEVRFVDGLITFDGTYAVPQVVDGYGTNFYLGEFLFNGTDDSYNIYVVEREIKQYRWLFNLLFMIALVSIVAVSIFLFFVIPEMPQLSFYFGVGFSILLIIVRGVLWIWKGW